MCRYVRMGGIAMMLALATTTLMGSSVALAASAAEIDPDVDVALKKLYDTVPGSKVLATRARGILAFETIVKGGFIVGAQYGPILSTLSSKSNRDVGTSSTGPLNRAIKAARMLAENAHTLIALLAALVR